MGNCDPTINKHAKTHYFCKAPGAKECPNTVCDKCAID